MGRILAIVGVVASIVILTLLVLLSNARGALNTTKVQLEAERTAFATEKVGLDAAVTDAQRLAAQAGEDAKRQAAQVARLVAESEDYRAQLRACQSPADLAKRVGHLFPTEVSP